jgi:hypothetical protein
MSMRIDKSWIVVASIETREGDRCVDLFSRPDGSFGFEEFRRDPEDAGRWTGTHYFSATIYQSLRDAVAAADQAVPWFAERNREQHGRLQAMPPGTGSTAGR